MSDLLRACAFMVSIDGENGLIQAGFQDVSGLGSVIQNISIDEPGHPGRHCYPIRSTQKPITLVRGIDLNRFLLEWYREVDKWLPGLPDYRRNLSIYLLNRNGDLTVAVRGWDIFDAYPLEWNGPDANSMSDNLAFENVVLHCGSFQEAPIGVTTMINL